MQQVIEAVFDGSVLHPKERLNLEKGSQVRILIETIPSPAVDKPRSFLQSAKSLRLDGPPDWSANLNQCLYNQETQQNG